MSARDCGCGTRTLAAYVLQMGWGRHSRFSSLAERENVSLCDIHQLAAIDNKNPNSDGVGTLLATELGYAYYRDSNACGARLNSASSLACRAWFCGLE